MIRIARHADSFWHRQIPIDAICIYRAGFAALLCHEALTWIPHTTELFSNQGFHLGVLSRYAPSPPVALLLCSVLALSAALTAVGFYTRASLAVTLALWAFLYGVDQLNEKAIFTIAMIVMTVLLFIDCGARYSLDDWRRQRRGLPRRPGTMCAFPFRILQLEFAQVYFFSGVTKLASFQWVAGVIIPRVLEGRWATEFGIWVSGWLPVLWAKLIAWTTIGFELLAGFLLFLPRARPWIIAAALMLHLGIHATLAIGSLGLHFMWALLLLFPDPETVARLATRVRHFGQHAEA